MTPHGGQSGQRLAPAAAPRDEAAVRAELGISHATGLTEAEASARLAKDGANEIPERRTHPLLRFLRKFWGLSAWMLELIALLSILLHKPADVGVALALLVVNAVLSFLQEQRATAAVSALRSRLQVMSRVLRDGAWRQLAARELVRGDIVRVRGGDFVPADVQILEGEVRVDQSVLTGESKESGKALGETVFSGSVVRQGELTGVVTATGSRTYFGRTAQLVESARPRLHIEEVTTRVVKWLFLIVGVLVSVAVVASLLLGMQLVEILPLSLVLLMGAVPVALPVMFTVSMAVGSMQLARRGVIITRLSAAEDAANMDVLCVDKTGTLTRNQVVLTDAVPQPGATAEDVIRGGALASNEADQDPIDRAFLHAARERKVLPADAHVLSFTPFTPKTRRTEAVVEVAGQRLRVVKGALRTVSESAGIEPAALAELEARAESEAQKGVRTLAVARAVGDEPLRLLGLALLYDAPRPDSRQLIGELRSLGVAIKMLTGDALPAARGIASELALGEVLRGSELRAAADQKGSDAAELCARADGFAEVFPEDKFLVVKSLQAAGHVVGMTGDGVNDAPALRQAEVGIAVSGASDVAKGAASAVLATEGLANLVDLVKNGRAIYQRVLTWIINKVSRTILKSGFVVVALLATGQFVISAFGMVLLVFMTDFVKIALSTDRVRASQRPESWNIGPLVKIAVVMGLLMLVEALALLAAGWRWFHLGNRDGRLQTFAFQTLLFFALCSLLSIRERRHFWASRPSVLLAAALLGDGSVGLLIGALGFGELRPLPLAATALILGTSLLVHLGINDLVKVMLMRRAGAEPRRSPAAPPARSADS